MRIHTYLVGLLIILGTSLASMWLLYTYMDVERDPPIAYAAMGLAVFLALTTLLTLLIFTVKKIVYRGEVYIHTVHSSLRQGGLLAIGCIGLVVFHMPAVNILTYETGFLLFSTLFFIEMIIGSIGAK